MESLETPSLRRTRVPPSRRIRLSPAPPEALRREHLGDSGTTPHAHSLVVREVISQPVERLGGEGWSQLPQRGWRRLDGHTDDVAGPEEGPRGNCSRVYEPATPCSFKAVDPPDHDPRPSGALPAGVLRPVAFMGMH